MKKTLKEEGCPHEPRVAPEPNKHNKSQQETYKPSTQTPQWARKVTAKKVNEERWVKKGDFKRPTSTIRHASGAFRPGADIFERRNSRSSVTWARSWLLHGGSGSLHGSSGCLFQLPSSIIWLPVFIFQIPVPVFELLSSTFLFLTPEGALQVWF